MCGISCILALDGRSQHPTADHSGAHYTNGHTNGDAHHHHPNGDDTTHAKIDPQTLGHASARKEIARDLDKSLDQIKHRGPDSRGHWISGDNRVGTLVNIPQLSPAMHLPPAVLSHPSARRCMTSTDKISQPSATYV